MCLSPSVSSWYGCESGDVCLSVSKRGFEYVNQHCLHVLLVSVDVGVSVVFMFFLHLHLQCFCVMKNKWTFDDGLIVWLMPRSSSFLREKYCSPGELH